MNETLLAAVQDRTWLREFQRRQYAGAFAAYAEQYGPAYAAAVTEAGADRLAEELMDALEKGWRQSPFWRRSVRQMEEKQMVVVYLSPLLLQNPDTVPLAEALARVWVTRHPRDGYRMAPWEEINAGFRNTILGFEIPKRD